MDDADAEQLFTVEEADHLLPQLRELLPRLREAYDKVDIQDFRTIRAATASNGGGTRTHAVLAAAEHFRQLLDEVEQLGVVVRDPQQGLVDFPAERDGEPIFLCWHLDDAQVGYWHSRDSGFADRQPLENG